MITLKSLLTPNYPLSRILDLPNGGGQYSSGGTIAPIPNAPLNPGSPTPIPNAPLNPGSPTPIPNAPSKPSKYINPKTGTYFATPEEYANYMVQKLPVSKATGDIGQYAGDAITQRDQSVSSLANTARKLNQTRNDIAVGATDPYKVAKDSGIAYSPAQLAAIEKAYAGIYDPVLDEVFTKIDEKEKKDAEELAQKIAEQQATQEHKNELEKLATQHKYNMELEKFKKGAGSGTSDVYIPEEDPTVDGWVERINRSGESLEKAIPGVANQGLRNKVMMGLNAKKYDSATVAGTINDINSINTLLQNPKLSSIVGPIDQYTGGIFGEARTARLMFDQLSGALQLAKAGSIKGQGQISDYERTVLKQAAIAAERGQNEEEFRKSLIKIRGAMMTASGLEAPVKITDPSTGKSDFQRLNTEEIKQFIKDGAIIEYVE